MGLVLGTARPLNCQIKAPNVRAGASCAACRGHRVRSQNPLCTHARALDPAPTQLQLHVWVITTHPGFLAFFWHVLRPITLPCFVKEMRSCI